MGWRKRFDGGLSRRSKHKEGSRRIVPSYPKCEDEEQIDESEHNRRRVAWYGLARMVEPASVGLRYPSNRGIRKAHRLASTVTLPCFLRWHPNS
jgi:hypothetical protein